MTAVDELYLEAVHARGEVEGEPRRRLGGDGAAVDEHGEQAPGSGKGHRRARGGGAADVDLDRARRRGSGCGRGKGEPHVRRRGSGVDDDHRQPGGAGGEAERPPDPAQRGTAEEDGAEPGGETERDRPVERRRGGERGKDVGEEGHPDAQPAPGSGTARGTGSSTIPFQSWMASRYRPLTTERKYRPAGSDSQSTTRPWMSYG